jgi:hypothetical protein
MDRTVAVLGAAAGARVLAGVDTALPQVDACAGEMMMGGSTGLMAPGCAAAAAAAAVPAGARKS